VIALGNDDAGDDGAALSAARTLAEEGVEVVLAGRPGIGLLDLLDPSARTVLLDVVRTGAAPGTLVTLPLDALHAHAVARARVSSHDLGPGEALQLADALGRPLPEGIFVGIEGACFTPGAPLSPGVREGMAALVDAARRAVQTLESSSASVPRPLA
jgi:hydrogenase maturation protease